MTDPALSLDLGIRQFAYRLCAVVGAEGAEYLSRSSPQARNAATSATGPIMRFICFSPLNGYGRCTVSCRAPRAGLGNQEEVAARFRRVGIINRITSWPELSELTVSGRFPARAQTALVRTHLSRRQRWVLLILLDKRSCGHCCERRSAQAVDQRKDVGEHLPRNGDLGHLENGVAASPFAAMTGLDRDTSRSPDRTGVCRAGRSAPSQVITHPPLRGTTMRDSHFG